MAGYPYGNRRAFVTYLTTSDQTLLDLMRTSMDVSGSSVLSLGLGVLSLITAELQLKNMNPVITVREVEDYMKTTLTSITQTISTLEVTNGTTDSM